MSYLLSNVKTETLVFTELPLPYKTLLRTSLEENDSSTSTSSSRKTVF